MKDYIKWLIIGAFAIIVGSVSYLNDRHSGEDLPLTEYQLEVVLDIAQDNFGQQRDYVAEVREDVSIKHMGINDSLWRPVLVSSDGSDEIAIFDAGDMTVKKVEFRADGDIQLLKLTEGIGDGPREISRPGGVEYAQDGTVWMYDRGRRDFLISTADSMYRVKSSRSVTRYAPISDDLNITFHGSQASVFQLMSASEVTASEFGVIIKDQDKLGIGLDGWITTDGDALFYVSMYSGVILSYGLSGELNWATTTIDGGRWPVVSHFQSGLSSGKSVEDMPLNTRSMWSDSGLLFVHQVLREEAQDATSVVDIYRTKDGDYYGSIYIGKKYQDVRLVKSNNVIVAFTDTSFTAHPIDWR